MSDGKITLDEMIALFGGNMPIEAVDILLSGDPNRTADQVRGELDAWVKEHFKPPSRWPYVGPAPGDLSGSVAVQMLEGGATYSLTRDEAVLLIKRLSAATKRSYR